LVGKFGGGVLTEKTDKNVCTQHKTHHKAIGMYYVYNSSYYAMV